MDDLVTDLCPGSKHSLVAMAMVEATHVEGIYKCSGISPTQEFRLASQVPCLPGIYTLYDLLKLPPGSQADSQVAPDSQFNRHDELREFHGFSTIDFCSGIGGFAIGSHYAGIPTGVFVECNPMACKVLQDNFDCPVLQGDLQDIQIIKRTHQLRPSGHVQLTAGFPCQPYSTQGDGRGLEDPRGRVLHSILRGAWLLQAQSVLLECVANVARFHDTQQLIGDYAQKMHMHCDRTVFDLHDQWPMHRNRFWCLMSSYALPRPSLRTWPATHVFTCIGSIMPLDAVWPDEDHLCWDSDEILLYGDPQYGCDQRVLGPHDCAATVLHSWGNVARPCPCGCRGVFSLERLRSGGARGFGLLSACTGCVRHMNKEEALLLCTVPLTFKFDMPTRSALCLLGQIAAPLSVLWIQVNFLHDMQVSLWGSSALQPDAMLLSYQQMLLRQVQQRWITATMNLPRLLHFEQEGILHEVMVNGPIRAHELLQAEKQLQGWGQYSILSCAGNRVAPEHLLHAQTLYQLDVRSAKHIKRCPIPSLTDAEEYMAFGLPRSQTGLDGLGDKLIWACLRSLVADASSQDDAPCLRPMLVYPFQAQALLCQIVHDQVILNWKTRYVKTDGKVILIFAYQDHWIVLAARPLVTSVGKGLVWTFFDGLRDHPFAMDFQEVAMQVALQFTQWFDCEMLQFLNGTVLLQHFPFTCGTIAVAHVAYWMGFGLLNPDDELPMHWALLQFQQPEHAFYAGGLDDTTEELALLLGDKGVPKAQALDRAKQVLAKLGTTAVQNILNGKNPWAALKAAASRPGVMFRLVTPDELARYVATRAKTQHGADIRNHKAKKKQAVKSYTQPLTVDPSKLILDSAYFKDGDDEPVPQVSFQDVVADQRGVALCTTQQAHQFLEQPKSISVDALAIIVVDHPAEEVIQASGLTKISFPAYCPGTEEHTLIFGYILQLGDGTVSRNRVGHTSRPEVVKTSVVKLQVFRDQFTGDWSRFIQSPIKALVHLMDSLQLCRGQSCGTDCPKFHPAIDESIDSVIFEVWARSFFDDRGVKTDPPNAACFTVFLRTPETALRAVLEGTPVGVYAEPRGEQPRQHDGTYRVVWLPSAGYAEAQHKFKTRAKSISLVRMRNKYGIRVLKEDEATVWAELRPGVDYMDLEVANIYELCPVPHGTQRQTMVQLLRDWQWSAKPLQPGKGTFSHMTWRVGASGPPPHMVMNGFDLDIVIRPSRT